VVGRYAERLTGGGGHSARQAVKRSPFAALNIRSGGSGGGGGGGGARSSRRRWAGWEGRGGCRTPGGTWIPDGCERVTTPHGREHARPPGMRTPGGSWHSFPDPATAAGATSPSGGRGGAASPRQPELPRQAPRVVLKAGPQEHHMPSAVPSSLSSPQPLPLSQWQEHGDHQPRRRGWRMRGGVGSSEAAGSMGSRQGGCTAAATSLSA
jgi:hypothetical protein